MDSPDKVRALVDDIAEKAAELGGIPASLSTFAPMAKSEIPADADRLDELLVQGAAMMLSCRSDDAEGVLLQLTDETVAEINAAAGEPSS